MHPIVSTPVISTTMTNPPKPGPRTPVPSVGVRFTVEVVTPADAKSWLNEKATNRNLRLQRVSQYAEDMRTDQWRMTGEPIKFDTGGQLIDGQHRLSAVLAAEREVTMVIARGLAPETRQFVDTGAARTPGDALRIGGESNPELLGSIARLVYHVKHRQHFSTRVSHPAIFETIAANPGLRSAAQKVMGKGYAHRIDLPPSITAYALFCFREKAQDKGDEFIDSLASLADLSADDPILRLNHRLRAIDRGDEVVSKKQFVVTLFRTWNLWRVGRSVLRVQIAPESSAIPELV